MAGRLEAIRQVSACQQSATVATAIRSDRPPATAPSDALRDLYERRAELQYAGPAALPDPSFDRKFERIWQLVTEHLPCDRFLDAGCGDGRYLAALASHPDPPSHLVAVDISERILETAAETASVAGIQAELVRANLEALPLRSGSFDLVLCTQVIEHLADPSAGLRELARVLAPCGVLVVSTDHDRMLVSSVLNAPRTAAVRLLGLRHRRVPVEFPQHAFGLDEFVGFVQQTGLRVEHAETFRFHLRWPLDRRPLQRGLNQLERRLPPHRLGDIVAVVARKPAN